MLTLSAEPRRLVSTHCLHLSMFHSQQFRVEKELLLLRLQYVKTSYLSPRSPLYGRHSGIPSQTNHGFGNQWTGEDRRKKYTLDLRLTWYQENVDKLAILFPPFQSIVAERLRKHPNIAPESMKHTLLLSFIRRLTRSPRSRLCDRRT